MKCTPKVRHKNFWRCIFNMTKYGIETKRKLVEIVERGKHSISSAAKELGISKALATRWMKMYEFHGYEGLVMKSKSYTGKFKVNVVEYMHANHLSVKESSAKFGIPSASTLLKWERIYYEEGAKGLMTDKRGRPRKSMDNKPKEKKLKKETEEDLVAEVQRLRAENAYLKKYNALVQEKERLENLRKQK